MHLSGCVPKIPKTVGSAHLPHVARNWHCISIIPKPEMESMGSQESSETVCAVCQENESVARCEGCGKPLCRRCRGMELYGSRDQEITIKYFCPSCMKDPKINPSTDSKKVFGLPAVTDMVNQDSSKGNKFKIKLKI